MMMYFETLMPLAYHGLAILILILFTRRLRRWPYLYALITWPGTIAHELLHFIAGLLTGAQPVGLSVTPKRQEDGTWQLGQVSFTRLRWWNSIPVGLAPMLLLPLGGWLFLSSTALPVLSMQGGILKLIVMQCLLSGWPSPQDWRHAIKGLVVIALLTALITAIAFSAGLIKL